MNILLFSDQYYPLGGGIEQYLRGLGRQLTAGGHRVTYLTRAVEGCPEEEAAPEGRVIRTPLLLGAVPDPQAVLDRWPQLVPLVKSIGPDVVYANHHTSLAAIRACRAWSVPVVYGCHGWGLLCPLKIRLLRPDGSLCYNERSVKNCLSCYRMIHASPRVTGMRKAASRVRWEVGAWRELRARVAQYDRFQELLESADARIGNSRMTASLFRSADTFAIYSGIDTDMFQPIPSEPLRSKYGIEGPFLLVTSRIHNTKGQDWAVRALAHLPKELKLVLAGNSSLFSGPKYEDNPHTRYVRQVIAELGLQDRVIATGFLSTAELAQAYSGAAVTLVPSVWLEAFGNVTVEAMACACPVVVTDNCGSAEVVSSGVDGFIVPRMDAEAIARAVMDVLPRREEMGRAARAKVMHELSWPKIAGQVLAVLEMAIAHRQPGRGRVRSRTA